MGAPHTAPSWRPPVLPITHLEDHVAGVILQEVDADDPNQRVLLVLLVQGVCAGIASSVTDPFRQDRDITERLLMCAPYSFPRQSPGPPVLMCRHSCSTCSTRLSPPAPARLPPTAGQCRAVRQVLHLGDPRGPQCGIVAHWRSRVRRPGRVAHPPSRWCGRPRCPACRSTQTSTGCPPPCRPGPSGARTRTAESGAGTVTGASTSGTQWQVSPMRGFQGAEWTPHLPPYAQHPPPRVPLYRSQCLRRYSRRWCRCICRRCRMQIYGSQQRCVVSTLSSSASRPDHTTSMMGAFVSYAQAPHPQLPPAGHRRERKEIGTFLPTDHLSCSQKILLHTRWQQVALCRGGGAYSTGPHLRPELVFRVDLAPLAFLWPHDPITAACAHAATVPQQPSLYCFFMFLIAPVPVAGCCDRLHSAERQLRQQRQEKQWIFPHACSRARVVLHDVLYRSRNLRLAKMARRQPAPSK